MTNKNTTNKIDKITRDFFKPFSSNETWIVGLSGGADSVALLASMLNCGLKCVPVHCNFGLRGHESDRDEDHCYAICNHFGLKLYVYQPDTYLYKNNKNVSVEMACRDLRYDYFNKIKSVVNAKGIVVAHHKEDNIETFFLNLLRGTGIAGLRGMLPITNNGIYRPFLDISRTEIEQYLEERGLSYVTDSSNLSDIYKRNRIRNILIPFINNYFPEAEKSIEKTLVNLRQTDLYLEEKLSQDKHKYVDATNSVVNIENVIKQEKHHAFILYNILIDFGFSETQINDIIKCTIKGHSGKLFFSDNDRWILDRGRLKRYDLLEGSNNPLNNFIISDVSFEEWSIPTDDNIIFLNGEGIDITDISARYWRPGDKMRPFGMKGNKKVSDIFTDLKIPVDIKHKIPFLIYDNKILWIPGIKRSDYLKVETDTKKILKIEWKGELTNQDG